MPFDLKRLLAIKGSECEKGGVVNYHRTPTRRQQPVAWILGLDYDKFRFVRAYSFNNSHAFSFVPIDLTNDVRERSRTHALN
jgi:hypothetical protein